MIRRALNSTAMAAAVIASAFANVVVAFSGMPLTGTDVLKRKMPSNFNVEAAGGWSEIERLAANPKAELVSLIVSGLKGSGGKVDVLSSEKLEVLEILLLNCGKGFGADLVDGQWVSVLSRQGQKSPKFQKFVNKRDNVQNSFANFDISTQTFLNLAYTPHQRGQLKALVEYNPVSDNYDVSEDGKVILRRISCDITDVNFKYWKLPKVTLPLKKKGGFLDFIYLDEDVRVTKGNRGGLFVHFRPEFLEKVMAQ